MKDLSWTVVQSEYLFKDLWFTVRKDRCRRPDGKLVDPYYVYEFPTWVTAFALTKDNEVILERQYRHGIGLTNLEIPGGCVDDSDPSLELAIARELQEETGYRFTQFDYLGKISANPSTNNNWMHMFLATGGTRTAEQQLDENEEIEIELVSITRLKELLRNNEIIQSMHVSAILYALAKLGELNY